MSFFPGVSSSNFSSGICVLTAHGAFLASRCDDSCVHGSMLSIAWKPSTSIKLSAHAPPKAKDSHHSKILLSPHSLYSAAAPEHRRPQEYGCEFGQCDTTPTNRQAVRLGLRTCGTSCYPLIIVPFGSCYNVFIGIMQFCFWSFVSGISRSKTELSNSGSDYLNILP